VRKRRFHYPGRNRIDDRRTLAGILFVLRTGIAWQQLPQELGYGFSRAVCDSASLRALLGAIKPDPVRLTGASSAASTT
jgi:hypothetical protein